MNVKTLKRPGGFVIKKQILVEALNEPDIVGLAFALNEPGKAENVDLQILAIFQVENTLVGKKVDFEGGKGAPSPMQYPAGPVDDFEFNFLSQLQKDKFAFGFYSKGTFELFLQGKEEFDEVFIGGAKVHFGEIDWVDQKDWFTLVLAQRKGIDTIIQRNGLKQNTVVSNGKITLPKPNNRSTISISTLEQQIPKIFNGQKRVNSLVMDKTSSYIQGITFSDSEGTQVLFNDKYKVQSILLSKEQAIRKLIVAAERPNEVIHLEDNVLGLFPNAVHTVPCPPHWPESGGNASSHPLKNTIAEAVFECMMID